MYNVNTPTRTTPLVLGGPMPQHATETLDKSHTATNQFHSFHRCRLVLNACCIRVAINTERGIACSASTRAHRPDSASASRLLVATSSPSYHDHGNQNRIHSGSVQICFCKIKNRAKPKSVSESKIIQDDWKSVSVIKNLNQ